MLTDLVDFDMCWAFDLADPWGNRYELNCYDYDRVRAELVEADAVEVVRYWPRDLLRGFPRQRIVVAASQACTPSPS